MIERYSRPLMAALWSEQQRFAHYLNIEILFVNALVKSGRAKQQTVDALKKIGTVDLQRVKEHEEEVGHEFIAFLSTVSEQAKVPLTELHLGLTSSDVLDTASALQLRDSGNAIATELKTFSSTLLKQAKFYKDSTIVGRTHGMYAEPTTFGIKLLGFYHEAQRNEVRLQNAIQNCSFGKLAGPVGTHSGVSSEIERVVLFELDLAVEPVATQVIPRDRHAHFFQTLALIATSLERIATEIRHLQRSEVAEVSEPFSQKQKGSSAMPHKQNPILSENICGLARLVRGYASTALENISLWHERDMSHSSAERIIAPDSCLLVDFMLHRMTSVIKGLVVDTTKMAERVATERGKLSSARLLTLLVSKGASRDGAYRAIQKHALEKISSDELEYRWSEDSEIKQHASLSDIQKISSLDYLKEEARRAFAEVDL